MYGIDPDMLITGSYDGDIVVWDIYTHAKGYICT